MPVIKIKKRKEPSNNEEVSRPRKLRIKAKVKEEDDIQPEVKKSVKRSKKSERGSGMKLKLNLRKSAEPEKPPKAPRLRVKPIRVPGEGYDSEASDIEDDPLIEEAIILRVLPDIQAEFVKHSIDSGDYSGISIKWKGQRHAIVNINEVSYGAIMINLPTIIEVNKSVDRKNLLKTVDVAQMLLCIQAIENEEEVFTLQPPDSEDLVSKHFEEYQDEIRECKMKFFKGYNDGPLTELESKHLGQIANKPYDYKHGLTPPLYNVRNRRFRRKMGLDEFEYVEKCVERLLRQDDQAEEVTYELVDEDEIQRRPTPVTSLSQLDNNQVYSRQTFEPDEKDEDDLDLDEAFQSDTEETKERVTFKEEAGSEIKENDLFDETGDDVEQYNGEEEDEEEEEEEEENEPDEDDEAEENAEGVQKQAVDEGRQHNELLKDELNELETTLNHARQKLQKAANPLLKSRFIESIKKLEREVELKRKQLKFSDETLQDEDAPSQEPQPQPATNTEAAIEEDDEDDEEDEEEEDEEEDDDDEPAEDRAAPDQPQELDQNDLDMMMLFGAEGDDAEE